MEERDRGGTGLRQPPTRDETFAAAVDLVSRGSAAFKRHARRFSICAADAEDAYQRSLEILLRKAPTADRSELRAWLHTVIKHEALAVRRQRERTLGGVAEAEPPEPGTEAEAGLDERASGRERIGRTAEALAHLKHSEIQCLLLKALGYSYDEIAERTGYSWTKVNRSLTEGRRRFLERFGEIDSGERCKAFESLLSTASDGEATAAEERLLKVHLSACGSCRAALRSYRAAPRRLAELLPPGLLVPALQQGGWWSRVSDWLSLGTGDRAGALAWKLQQGSEALGAQKAAAVVASTAALAGGAAVQEQRVHHSRSARAVAESRHDAKAKAAEATPVTPPAPVRAAPLQRAADAAPAPESRAAAAPAEEFAPTPAVDSTTSATRAESHPPAGEFGGPSSGAASGAGTEFGP